jgi:hypothetical protein
MRLIFTAALLAVIGGATIAAVKSTTAVQRLAGRYSEHFRNGNIDGDKYWSDNVVEIVPIDPSHAYFKISLQFFNGHSCSLHGVARATGAGLDYFGSTKDYAPGCHMTLRRNGSHVLLDDHDGTCQSSCGARGGYGGDGLPWNSKRSISYQALIKGSSEYRAALDEWRRSGAK